MKNYIAYAVIVGPILGLFVWIVTGMLSLVVGLAALLIVAAILDKKLGNTHSEYGASDVDIGEGQFEQSEDMGRIPFHKYKNPAVFFGGVELAGWEAGLHEDAPGPFVEQHDPAADLFGE